MKNLHLYVTALFIFVLLLCGCKKESADNTLNLKLDSIKKSIFGEWYSIKKIGDVTEYRELSCTKNAGNPFPAPYIYRDGFISDGITFTRIDTGYLYLDISAQNFVELHLNATNQSIQPNTSCPVDLRDSLIFYFANEPKVVNLVFYRKN